MPVPVGFQLGLELTNIVNPISQVVSALGSLALVDAIRKAGSDSITETKLASLLGRHRIDDVIKFHFRKIVAKADQSLISRYMDIVLESGAGPTVQEALKNPALFSMVIQLSGLAFAHEHESFALAMVEAIDRIVRDSGGDVGIVPDYVALLGTIRACQEQTAAFQWAALYEAVEHKIQSALKSKIRVLSNDVTESAGEEQADIYTPVTPESVSIRCLPFTVFQSLIMWLQSLQSFPEHRLLHLRCDSGISTVVVWCHHILGLTVTVQLEKCDIRFGDGLSRVIVEESLEEDTGASLMDPADQHEPLFSLVNDDSSPMIAHEHRIRAFGYGLKTLQQVRLSDENIHYCSHWIIARSIMISQILSAAGQNGSHDTNSSAADAYFEPRQLSEDMIVRAGKFLFSLEGDDWKKLDAGSPRIPSKICWPNLVAMVFTFARIEPNDLEGCRNMPLCLNSFRSFGDVDDLGQDLNGDIQSKGFENFDLVASFGVLTRLLLGKAYSTGYIEPCVLVSAWGWSIFFDVVDADDPIDVSVNAMRVVCGVPSRRGLRKARIIDGPNDMRPSTLPRSFTKEDEIMRKCEGLTNAKRDRILVGQTFDAFQIMQIFKWSDGVQPKGGKRSTYSVARMGFREMQEICIHAKRIPACNCVKPYPGFKDLFDKTEDREVIQEGSRRYPGWTNSVNPDGFKSTCTIRRPKGPTDQLPSQERVLRCRIWLPDAVNGGDRHTWLFDVSKNPAARWVQSWYLCPHDDDERCCLAIKGSDTCWKCASDKALEFASDKALLEKDMRIRVLL